MIRRPIPIAAAAMVLAFALGTLPAAAQYATEFSEAKLVKQGTTSADVAGTGTVVVQVQVNADGTHKAIKVIKSTNAGDNDAAMEIAQNSTYKPAHRGTTPITAYYDFTLKFNGKSVAQSPESGDLATGPAAQITAMIKAKQYDQAKQAATAALAAAPNDTLRQLLGVADAQTGDFDGATAAFDAVGTIGPAFVPVAAQSYAHAAVTLSPSDPAKALTYAQKAVSLQPSTSSKYALGVAQVANAKYADAIATLRAVHTALFADPQTPVQAKVMVDSSLMVAYQQTGDTADVQAAAAEVKQLDPTSTVPARVLGNALLASAIAAMAAKDYVTAQKDFDQAAAAGDPAVAVTANTQAALLLLKGEKPDYTQVQAYADKALAIQPDDAMANFIEGIALTAEWATLKAHDPATMKKAGDALAKADQLAKAAGNQPLASQIEDFMKKNPLKPPAGDSGSTAPNGPM